MHGDAEADFTAEVRRRATTAEVQRAGWRAARAALSDAAKSAFPAPGAPPQVVDRLDASSCSVAAFRTRFIAARVPAVLTGLVEVLAQPYDDDDRPSGGAAPGAPGAADAPSPPSGLEGAAAPSAVGGAGCGGLDRDGWLEWLARTCGTKRVVVAVQGDEGMGCSSSMMLLGDLVARLQSGRAHGLYLYDVCVSKRLPHVLRYMRLPRHFAHCYLRRTMHAHAFSRSWPTLFLGARGTRSTLHLDQWEGHFYMYCLFGCKRWVLFHPEDVALLYPDWSHGGLHPRFPSLYELQAQPQRYPLFAHARRREVVIHPGEVLFVPGGTPHAVENLTDSLALAGNFVDASNLDEAVAEMRWLGRVDEGVGAAAAALAQIDWETTPDGGSIDERAGLPPAQLVTSFPE